IPFPPKAIIELQSGSHLQLSTSIHGNRIPRRPPCDIAQCIDIRGKTRENAISAKALADIGITETSWSAQVATASLPGYICMASGRMVGYCFGAAESGEIVVLALLPEHESKGIGKELLRLAMSKLHSLGHKRLFLGYNDDPNVRSYGFYRHLGWHPNGETDSHGDEVLEYIFNATS
ncbi:MAG TPA: GNAT family N-acetyltransferase, partial [Steroidobacteraceae bacterium]